MATPRKPQDRKPAEPTNAEKQISFADTEGHELLRPFSEIKASDQARLMNRVKDLLPPETAEGDDVDLSELDLDAVADFIDYLEGHYVTDADGWAEFSVGQGALERALNLVLAYVGEMGKGAA